MSDIQRKKGEKVVDYKGESRSVKIWGPQGDEANFIQQTMNCIHCCEIAIKNIQKFPEDLEICLNSKFVCSLDEQVNAKSTKKQQKMMSQKFWMFHHIDKKEIYVVFPSQETTAHILVDSYIWTMPKQKDITNVDNIPISFFKALILRGYNLVFTGHSLGGALAILVTCKLVNKDLELDEIEKIRCITFGAPQVPYTNSEYMQEFKDIIYRYELPDDPVPELLTAFQTKDNPNNNRNQEFLVNLMNLLGIQHSLRNTAEMEFGLVDFIALDKSDILKVKKYSKFGTVLIPNTRQRGWFLSKIEYEFEQASHWKFLGESNQKQVDIKLHQFLIQLKGNHQFERYRKEILQDRIAFLELPKVDDEFKNSDMSTFRLPISKFWIQGPENFESHNTQIVASYDERFTKVVLTSTLPHVFTIRFAQVEEFPHWGMEAARVIQDRQQFQVMIVFYSAQDYKELKEKNVTTLSVSLHGYFESIKNIKVEVVENTSDETEEMRNLAYKNINVQQLYTSAFQACLFAGEGHNPMLQKKDLTEEQREALLKEDRNSLVEILGSLIVNQEIFKIITHETRIQFQQFLAKHTHLNHCLAAKDLLSAQKVQELTSPIIEQAQKQIDDLYNQFEFSFKKQQYKKTEQPEVKPEKMDAKDCITESTPILFCLSSQLIWQLKNYFCNDFLFNGAVAAAPGVLGAGLASNSQLPQQLKQLMQLGPGGIIGAAAFLTIFAVVGVLSSLVTTRNQFINYIQNYETMQVQYRQQLVILVKKMGYYVKASHTIADLEKIVAKMCEWLLKQEEIEYEYEQSENKLNQILYERITKKENSSGEPQEDVLLDDVLLDDLPIQSQILQQLIEKKVEYLSKKNIFEKCDKDIQLHPSKCLAALLIFVWNNYRMRLCLSKTWRIGIMGAKNAGKSSLSKMLGCEIPQTGQNHPTTDATLYQNVPVSNFCVIDFPHLDNVDAKDCMRMFYSLADIAIIVMKSQDGASEEGKNKEVGQIIQSMKMKYGNLGFGNRKFPILLLLNQVDQMVFNEDGEDPDNEELKQNFQSQQADIFKNLEDVGVDKDEIECLFTALLPKLPEPSQEISNQWLQDRQNNKITQKEYNQKIKQGDKNRLQEVTNCSFFKFQEEVQQNENSVVNVLAEMVENLGDRDEANSLRAVFNDHEDVVVVNTPLPENRGFEN